MSCATALITATHPSAELAGSAVAAALSAAGMNRAQSVLLLLSEACLPFAEAGLRQAAKVAGTLSVTGCIAPGLLTEQDWVVDAPAAAALVLDSAYPFLPTALDAPCLTLAAPNALAGPWLNGLPKRYGGVAGDATGLGPYCVWHQARLSNAGRIQLQLGETAPAILSLPGYHALSEPVSVTAVEGNDLLKLGGEVAASHLRLHAGALPLHEMAIALQRPEGQIQWSRLVANDRERVTIASLANPGDQCFWGSRNPSRDEALLDQWLTQQAPPAFALLFLPATRMPLDTGREPLLSHIRHIWPNTPILGFYGNGLFTPQPDLAPLLDQGLVLAAFGGQR